MKYNLNIILQPTLLNRTTLFLSIYFFFSLIYFVLVEAEKQKCPHCNTAYSSKLGLANHVKICESNINRGMNYTPCLIYYYSLIDIIQ